MSRYLDLLKRRPKQPSLVGELSDDRLAAGHFDWLDDPADGYGSDEKVLLAPQPGMQTAVLGADVDILLMGGSGGCSKTFTQLMVPLEYLTVPGFTFAFFRRTRPELTGPDGLWSESKKIYPMFGGVPKESPQLKWTFPTPGVEGFGFSVNHPDDVLKYRSTQICCMCIDEASTFPESIFWGLVFRNRSACGVRPFIRMGTNPDPDSFLIPLFLKPNGYLTPDGYPNWDMAGKVRYFYRDPDGEMKWSSDKQELVDELVERGTAVRDAEFQVKSFTFIPGRLDDNQKLLEKDPTYRGTLMLLPPDQRKLLYEGNWYARPQAGEMLPAKFLVPVEDVRQYRLQRIDQVRAWDLAYTRVREDQYLPSDEYAPATNDPDWTRGMLMGKCRPIAVLDLVIEEVIGCRDHIMGVEQMIYDTAERDGYGVTIVLIQGAGGEKGHVERFEAILTAKGYKVEIFKQSKSKTDYAQFPASYIRRGRMGYLLDPDWNQILFNEMNTFPLGAHDDIIDVLSGCCYQLGEADEIGDGSKLNPWINENDPRAYDDEWSDDDENEDYDG